MKLFYLSLCPVSLMWRMLICYLNFLTSNTLIFKEILILDYNTFANLCIEKVPLLETHNYVINNNMSFFNFIKNHYNTSLINTYFSSVEIINFQNYLDSDVYYLIYKHFIYKKLHNKILEKHSSPFVYTEEISKNKEIFLNRLEKIFSESDWINKNFSINDIGVFAYLICLNSMKEICWRKYTNLFSFFERMSSNKLFATFLLEN